MSKVAKYAGYALLYAGVGLILTGYLWVWHTEGFAKLIETASPFNLWNALAVVITLAPGLGLIYLSNKLKN